MRREIVARCPVCENELQVTRLQCEQCGTAIEGRFTVGRFGRLSREQLALLESFLRARGNLRDVERELGVSYPTVRARVEALVRALGLAGEVGGDAAATQEMSREPAAHGRREILERLARREITAEEAAVALRALSGVHSGHGETEGDR